MHSESRLLRNRLNKLPTSRPASELIAIQIDLFFTKNVSSENPSISET